MYCQKSLHRGFSFLLVIAVTLAGCAGTQPGSTPIPTPTSPDLILTPDSDEYERFDISEDMHARQIQDGVFVVTHAFPWPANSMIVEMENSSLVLVDTPYTPEATRDLLDWAKAQLGEREIVAINTGFHCDNLGGNSYLVEQGIPVYGADLTAQLIEDRGVDMRALTLSWLQAPRHERYYNAHESLPYVAPTHQFELSDGLVLEFGAETARVYYPGPSHAPDNVVVYFPARKILFGGCMIIGWDEVGNTADADLEAWPDSVRDLARLDFDVLVPGHGDRLDPGLLEHTVDLLVEFQE